MSLFCFTEECDMESWSCCHSVGTPNKMLRSLWGPRAIIIKTRVVLVIAKLIQDIRFHVDMAAARRTLLTEREPAAHCLVTPLPKR